MPLTKQGAERLAGAAATRGGVLCIEEAQAIRSLVKNPIIQGDGAKVFIHQVSPFDQSSFDILNQAINGKKGYSIITKGGR